MGRKSGIIFGVGYVGEGPHRASRKDPSKAYDVWYQMLYRCYMDDEERGPGSWTYQGCSVCNEWLNYQNFASWYKKYKKPGFHIDKDILIPGNKIYSPEFCEFVPSEINTCLTHSTRKRRSYDGLPTGVSFCRATGKYYASIQENGKSTAIGKWLFGYSCVIPKSTL